MDTLLFAGITVVAILSSLYLYGLSQVSNLKKNWPQYRCNPLYMPFAGMVGDDVMTNFTKCTLKGFHDYTGYVMDPLVAEFSVVNDTLEEVTGTLGDMRSMVSSVRGGFLGILGTVFGKLQNVMGQTQYIVIRMRTLLSRVVAVMFSFVYIFYGGMQSGQSLVNGPVGRTMSVLCFDENTPILTIEGVKDLKDVRIGDRLMSTLALVTSVYHMDGTGVQMYSLSGILVSGSHKVRYKRAFIRVDQHPAAKKVAKTSSRLVCLNTTSHRITIKNYEFLDFLETEDSEFEAFKNTYIQMLYNGRVTAKPTYSYAGLLGSTVIPLRNHESKEVRDIEIGDILDNGDVVKGICVHTPKDNLYVEVDTGILVTPGTWVYKDNQIVRADSVGRLQTDGSLSYVYQLITESSMFPVLGTKSRVMVLDELQTTDSFYHSLKDSMITAGRFRSKVIVV